MENRLPAAEGSVSPASRGIETEHGSAAENCRRAQPPRFRRSGAAVYTPGEDPRARPAFDAALTVIMNRRLYSVFPWKALTR